MRSRCRHQGTRGLLLLPLLVLLLVVAVTMLPPVVDARAASAAASSNPSRSKAHAAGISQGKKTPLPPLHAARGRRNEETVAKLLGARGGRSGNYYGQGGGYGGGGAYGDDGYDDAHGDDGYGYEGGGGYGGRQQPQARQVNTTAGCSSLLR